MFGLKKNYRIDEALVLLETNQPLSFEQQQIIAKKVNEILNHQIILIHTKTSTSNVWAAIAQKEILVTQQKQMVINVYSPICLDNLDDTAKDIICAKYHNVADNPLEFVRFEPMIRRPVAMIDQFIYAICYAICEDIGQDYSDFVIGINEDGSTENIRRIVADIIRSGNLPDENVQEIWQPQQ